MALYDLVTVIVAKLEADADLSDYVKEKVGVAPAFFVEGSVASMSPPSFLVAVDKAVLPRTNQSMAAATIRITGHITAVGNGQEVCLGAAERIGVLLRGTLTGGKVKGVSLDDIGEEPGIGWAFLISVDVEVTA